MGTANCPEGRPPRQVAGWLSAGAAGEASCETWHRTTGHPSGGHRREAPLDQHAAFPGDQRPPVAAIAPAVRAQQPAPVRPPDKPPIAQGWIDIATFASPGGMGGMAGMMMGGGGGDTPMSALFGGKKEGEPVRADARGRQRQLRRRDAAHQPQPEPRRGSAGRAPGQQARADAAAQGTAPGQAGTHRPRGRFDRGADRATQGQDQAVLGLRHGHPAGATEGRGLRDEHDQGVRRHLQRPARHATRHAFCTGTSRLAESHRQPPRARRRIARGSACVQRPGRA